MPSFLLKKAHFYPCLLRVSSSLRNPWDLPTTLAITSDGGQRLPAGDVERASQAGRVPGCCLARSWLDHCQWQHAPHNLRCRTDLDADEPGFLLLPHPFDICLRPAAVPAAKGTPAHTLMPGAHCLLWCNGKPPGRRRDAGRYAQRRLPVTGACDSLGKTCSP